MRPEPHTLSIVEVMRPLAFRKICSSDMQTRELHFLSSNHAPSGNLEFGPFKNPLLTRGPAHQQASAFSTRASSGWKTEAHPEEMKTPLPGVAVPGLAPRPHA